MVTSRVTLRSLRNFPMIEDIWIKLQDYIPLRLIYEKLPQDDLFELRLVCKEWNHAALQRLLPKPSFVTIITWTRTNEGDWDEDQPYGMDGDEDHPYGIFTYNVDGDKFTCLAFRSPRFRLRPKESHVPPFEVEGLILCHNPNNMEERGVFNVHTRTWHAIPSAPYTTSDGRISACGLIVDTTVKPFTFKLIEGFADIKTKVYDSQSQSWSTKPSQLLEDREYPMYYTCVCKNETAYMSVGENTILKYSMEADMWSTLEFPVVIGEAVQPVHNTIGVWEGRMFTARENLKDRRVTVWELVNEEKQEWVEYACMSEEMYQWLSEHDFPTDSDIDDDYEYAYLRSFFRDGFLLFCMMCFWPATALVLFNMATRQWRMVHRRMDQPMTRIGYGPDIHQSFDEQEDSINTLEDIDLKMVYVVDDKDGVAEDDEDEE